MSMIGDAMKTIESVVLLRNKVERLTEELAATNAEVKRVVDTVIHIDRRLVRLETIDEMRTGLKPLPRIER